MKEGGLITSQSLCTFPSPPGPCNLYQDNKGWSSERVPHPHLSSAGGNISRRRRTHIGSLSTPFSSGRTLPSKWEDAERWICGSTTPSIGYFYYASSSNNSQILRRPKSKSGPIMPPTTSPTNMAQFGHNGEGSLRNLMVNSPFSTGVLMPHKFGVHCYGSSSSIVDVNGVQVNGVQVNVPRSVSMPGWSDLVSDSSFPSPPDEKINETNEPENMVARVTSRRDMATQMSPDCSVSSSSRDRLASPSAIPPIEPTQDEENSSPLQIKEVQVDKRASVTSLSKWNGSSIIKKSLPGTDSSFSRNVTGNHSSSCWDITEAASEFSKLQREEAKISAWENLQKAKAEAAIRKLEMKLEKKRASSMRKILKRLKIAEIKAQEMRSTVSQNPKPSPSDDNSRASDKHSRLSSFGSCFACHSR